MDPNTVATSAPDVLLKLPDGHAMQLPADDPPQPLRKVPAEQAAALQMEQGRAPDPGARL